MCIIEIQSIQQGLFTCLGVILGGGITFLTNKYMYETKVIQLYKQKRLQKLYLPIKKEIMPYFSCGLYEKLDKETVTIILKIVENNIELVDQELESYYWEYLEVIRENEVDNSEDCFRTQEFTSHIDKTYQKLRDDLFFGRKIS